MAPKSGQKANPRWAAFAQAYPVTLSPKAAAIAAGYPESDAARRGSVLLKNPRVAVLVQREMEARSFRTGVSADAVIHELMTLAKVDIGGAFDESGDIRPLHEMDENVRRCVASVDIEVRTEGRGDAARHVTVKRIRFWEKNKSLELLARHLGLLIDRHEVRVGPSLEELLTRSLEPENLPAEEVPEAIPAQLEAHQ